jgi:predicted 3-demethylubiquinone-9 3-methyltransferase (glyoxalase superfamily)
MAKFTPHLWFDHAARQGAELYSSVFPDSRITHITTLRDTPSGDADVVSFELAGQPFMAINGGPYFKPNPSVSLLVRYNTQEEVDSAWEKLLPGGMALMELGEYPFSQRFGWLQDRFGFSWQLLYTNGEAFSQKIVPMVMFVGRVCGRAEEAVNFWASVFKPAQIGEIMRYGKGEEPDKPGTVKLASFWLMGVEFAAIDSAWDHKFAFNEAISFMVSCEDQAEIDYYWQKLSAVPEAEQCGWLKDKFGLSWQVTPSEMDEMMARGTPEQIDRVTQAFLPMKKIDIAQVRAAYRGEAWISAMS